MRFSTELPWVPLSYLAYFLGNLVEGLGEGFSPLMRFWQLPPLEASGIRLTGQCVHPNGYHFSNPLFVYQRRRGSAHDLFLYRFAELRCRGEDVKCAVTRRDNQLRLQLQRANGTLEPPLAIPIKWTTQTPINQLTTYSTDLPKVPIGYASDFVRCLINGMAKGYAPLMSYWKLPPLYSTGVRFEIEPAHGSGNEDFACPLFTYLRGRGDCDDLVIYRQAELLAESERASCSTKWLGGQMHVQVRRADGVTAEDPSILLGAKATWPQQLLMQ